MLLHGMSSGCSLQSHLSRMQAASEAKSPIIYAAHTAHPLSCIDEISSFESTIAHTLPSAQAKYQVQFDNTVINLDASADTTAFRQELFAHTFSASGVHTVKLIAVLAGDGIKGRWLDVDYITFSAGKCVCPCFRFARVHR